MKSKLIFISMFFVCILFSKNVFAGMDKLLENAIANAKVKIDIPANYTKFNSNIEVNRNSQIFYLYWSGENTDNQNGGNISVKVDDKGRIIYYNQFRYGEFDGNYKLSLIDYNGAEVIAKKYISSICPEFAKDLNTLSAKNYIARNSENYNIIFYRYENGVPYYNNYVIAAISGRDSTLRELQVVWDDFEKFPNPSNAMAVDEAQNMFKEKIGVKLGYYNNPKDNTKILQYATNIDGNNYISAYTGEVIDSRLPPKNKFVVNLNSYLVADGFMPITADVPLNAYVTATTAFDELANRVGFELQYIARAKKNIANPETAKDVDIMLVYSFKPNKPLFVSGETGKLTNALGKPYDYDLPKFSDIDGHPSQKHINTLVSCGILKQEEKFRPDEKITQREYLHLALKALGKYKESDNYDFYENLLAGKIITIYEKDENSEITNEQAIKYLVRLLGYTDVAELEDTYKTGFVDEGMIDTKLIGYAAIAKGLKIIRGNAFAPKQSVNRATAAEIFYNLLVSN